MLWRQCDPENLESQIARVLEGYGASEQIASDCADEVRGLLARVDEDAAVERMLDAWLRWGQMEPHPGDAVFRLEMRDFVRDMLRAAVGEGDR